jgi:hypothetical protein
VRVRSGSRSDLRARLIQVCSIPNSGHRATTTARPKSADIVAKVFLGGRTKFFRAADAFYERRREDHIVSSKIDQGSP